MRCYSLIKLYLKNLTFDCEPMRIRICFVIIPFEDEERPAKANFTTPKLQAVFVGAESNICAVFVGGKSVSALYQ